MCACVRYIRLCVEQMFLIKHIISRVIPWIINSSSVCEKAAVKGAMGKRSSVLQREEPALVMGGDQGRRGWG